MIFFMIKYRFKEGRKSEYSHGNNKLEIIWTSATTVSVLLHAAKELDHRHLRH